MGLKIVAKKREEIALIESRVIHEKTIVLREEKIKSLLSVIDNGGSLLDEIVYKNVFDDIVYLLQQKGNEGLAILKHLRKNNFCVTFE